MKIAEIWPIRTICTLPVLHEFAQISLCHWILNYLAKKSRAFEHSELVEKIVWRKKPMQTTTNSTKRALNLCWKMMPMFDDLLSPKLFAKNWENAKEFPTKTKGQMKFDSSDSFIHWRAYLGEESKERHSDDWLTLSAKQLALDSLPLSSRRIF